MIFFDCNPDFQSLWVYSSQAGQTAIHLGSHQVGLKEWKYNRPCAHSFTKHREVGEGRLQIEFTLARKHCLRTTNDQVQGLPG